MQVRRSVMAAVCGALALTACTDREITRPEPVPITQSRLERAAVTFDDLGEPFRRAEPEGGIGESVVDHRCDDGLEDIVPREEAVSASTDGGALLESIVAWFPGQGPAVPARFRAAAVECAAVSETGAKTAVRAEVLNFGALSDDTLALSFETEPAGGAITETALVVMRRGDLVSMLRMTGPRPVSRETLDQAARIAIGRLALLEEQTAGA